MRQIVLAAAVTLAPAWVAADSIDTFRSLCLPTLGDTAATKRAAEQAGFDVFELEPDSFLGSRTATDETLQVNVATRHTFECAVTTSDMANPADVTARFFAMLGLTPRGAKASGSVNGERYTFMHDTNDGEAFVVFAD